jgi:hypothetical protein
MKPSTETLIEKISMASDHRTGCGILSVVDVGGTVDGRFAPVREAFETVLASQSGTGAAVAAWCDGRWVVDLWGGAADAAGSRPWRADSIVQPYSVT